MANGAGAELSTFVIGIQANGGTLTTTLIQLLATVAVLANAVIYGADVFAAVIQRTVLASVDDAALISVVGHGHRIGDQRYPIFGITGLISTVLVTVAAAVGGHGVAAIAAGIGVVALVVWLGIFARVSAPVNKQLTAAAVEGHPLANARELQATWDSVINLRVALQTVALVGLCVALAAV